MKDRTVEQWNPQQPGGEPRCLERVGVVDHEVVGPEGRPLLVEEIADHTPEAMGIPGGDLRIDHDVLRGLAPTLRDECRIRVGRDEMRR